MYVVLMLEIQSMPTMMLTYFYGRSRKSLGQELKLINCDQHHQELLKEYDFVGFSVRIDKRRTGNLKNGRKRKERREGANANQRAARGIFAHLPKNENR
jgi:hypothetical protein